MDKVLEAIDFFSKILGPAFLTFVSLFGLLGYGILDIYKYNIAQNVANNFPSQFHIQFYFYAAIAGIIFLVIIISLQTKITALSSTNISPSPNPPATDSNTDVSA